MPGIVSLASHLSMMFPLTDGDGLGLQLEPTHGVGGIVGGGEQFAPWHGGVVGGVVGLQLGPTHGVELDGLGVGVVVGGVVGFGRHWLWGGLPLPTPPL
jgi:hypothetical protein